nr:SpoIIE family protein phosphatase [Planctomycetota bacterium]
AQASLRAMRLVETSLGQPTTRVLEDAHRALAATRGAAMSLCDIDPEAGLVRFSGIGNVAGAIYNDGHLRCLVSHNGTVGLSVRMIQEFSYPWTRDSLLVLHSDGVVTRWNFDATPGLTMRHPSIVAAVLRRDFARGHDDVCVVVVREGP